MFHSFINSIAPHNTLIIFLKGKDGNLGFRRSTKHWITVTLKQYKLLHIKDEMPNTFQIHKMNM